jgi:hypothetical protein
LQKPSVAGTPNPCLAVSILNDFTAAGGRFREIIAAQDSLSDWMKDGVQVNGRARLRTFFNHLRDFHRALPS